MITYFELRLGPRYVRIRRRLEVSVCCNDDADLRFDACYQNEQLASVNRALKTMNMRWIGAYDAHHKHSDGFSWKVKVVQMTRKKPHQVKDER
nr:hypothetical protein CFP56_10049 [Quercus suber]